MAGTAGALHAVITAVDPDHVRAGVGALADDVGDGYHRPRPGARPVVSVPVAPPRPEAAEVVQALRPRVERGTHHAVVGFAPELKHNARSWCNPDSRTQSGSVASRRNLMLALHQKGDLNQESALRTTSPSARNPAKRRSEPRVFLRRNARRRPYRDERRERKSMGAAPPPGAATEYCDAPHSSRHTPLCAFSLHTLAARARATRWRAEWNVGGLLLPIRTTDFHRW